MKTFLIILTLFFGTLCLVDLIYTKDTGAAALELLISIIALALIKLLPYSER